METRVAPTVLAVETFPERVATPEIPPFTPGPVSTEATEVEGGITVVRVETVESAETAESFELLPRRSVAGGYQLELPLDWADVTEETSGEVLASIGVANEGLAERMQHYSAGVLGDRTTYLAVHLNFETIFDSNTTFLATAVVIRSDLSGPLTADEAASAIAESIEDDPSVLSPIARRSVRINNSGAVELRFRQDIGERLDVESAEAVETMYVVTTDEHLFFLVFDIPPELADQYAPVVEQCALSFLTS